MSPSLYGEPESAKQSHIMASFFDILFGVVKRTAASEIGRTIGKKIGDVVDNALSTSTSTKLPSGMFSENGDVQSMPVPSAIKMTTGKEKAVSDFQEKMRQRIETYEKEQKTVPNAGTGKKRSSVKRTKKKPT